MAAVAHQNIAAAADGRVKVKARHTAAAAPALAVLNADHDHRAGIYFYQTAGHDADHARVVSLAPHQDHLILNAFGMGCQLLLCLLHDLLFGGLAFLIFFRKLFGHLLGALRVLTQQKAQSQRRIVHAPGGIQPGGQRKADGFGCYLTVSHTCSLGQSSQTRPEGFLQLHQALTHQCAVFAHKGHHIRHRANGRQITAVIQHFVRAAAFQRSAQLKRYACTGKPLERAFIVLTLRVYHSHGIRQALGRQVMVGDHQFNAKLLGVLGFFHRRNAIVHRDDKMIALFRQFFQNRFVQAIAFILAAGQTASNTLRAHIAQILIQKCGGCDAIHIIIAKNHDRLAAFHCTVDALHRLIHILEQKRI